jgi:hypothetical protein
LLEAVDTAVSSTPGEATIGLLFERLVVLESQLSAWLRTHLQHPGTENNSLEHTPPTRRTNPNVFDLTCESLCRISLLLAVESLDDLLKYHSHHHHHHSQPNHNFHQTTTTTTIIPPLEVLTAELCRTATHLFSAATTPINRARTVSGPIHFLRDFFTRKEDEAGLRWCDEMKGRVYGGDDDYGEEAVAFLRWDALLPWCLLDFHQMFVRD